MISCIFYYDEIRIKLISSSMFVTLNYASKLLSVSLFALIRHISITSSPFDYVLNGQMQMIACIIMTLVIVVITAMRKVDKKFARILVNTLIFILPLMILFMSMHLLKDITVMNLYFNITLLLFCYIFLLFFIVDQITYSNINLTTSQLVKERLNMQTIYYKDIQKYNQNMSRFKHDMMNHFSNIGGMLENNDIDEAKEYLQSIGQRLSSVKSVINTGNSVIDVIFNSKVTLARENNIVCNNTIVVPPKIHMDSVDLSVILSNLIDNAIEATLKIDENRFIDTHIHIYKHALFISVKNSFDGNIRTSKDVYLSTKKSNLEHGIGLKNIVYVIQKYNGTKNIEHDDKTFTISIMIPDVA